MAKQVIGIGNAANDGSGDPLRTAGDKINDNFNEFYSKVGDGSNLHPLTFPNVTGTVLTTANSNVGATTTSSSDADHVLVNDGGILKKITPANLGIGSAYTLLVQEEGTNTSATGATTLNFVGAGVVASGTGATKTITISGGGSGITVQDEGNALSTVGTTLNFVGAGVTASGTGATKTITITGGGLSDTDALTEGSTNLYFTNARATTAITGSTLNMGSNDIITTGKILYSNNYLNVGDLPSASSYHGMFAHVHSVGAAYYAHAGNWIRLADHSNLYSDSSVDTHLNTGSASSGQILSWNGSDYAWVTDQTGGSGTTNLNSLNAGVINTQNDSIGFIDADDSNNSKKESIADFLTAIAGSGISVSSGQLTASSGSGNAISQLNSNVTVTDTGTDGTITFDTDGTDRWQFTNAGHLLPVAHETYDIGSASQKVRHLFLSDSSLKFGDSELSLSVVSSRLHFNSAKLMVDLSDDTTPQLGADLDVNGKTIMHTFNVGNNGNNHYTFSDAGNVWFQTTKDDPILYLRRGEQYKFVVNASGHPFQIRVSNGGSAHNDGVTNNGAQVGTVIFKVPMDAPATLYYQCTIHGGMGNIINIV